MDRRRRAAVALAAILGGLGFGIGYAQADDAAPQGLEISTVSAPLDYAAPAGRTVTLRYAVAAALDPHASGDPIFVLEPLAESSVEVAPKGLLQTLAALRRDHDLVFVDQRGVWGEGRLACPDPDPTVGAFDPARLARCAGRFDPDLLRSLNAGTFANDVETVRQRLGHSRIVLVGFFYGARIGLDYLGRWPERVSAAAFTDVAPSDAAGSVEGAWALDAGAVATIAACRAEPACQARHPALDEDFAKVLRRLDTPRLAVLGGPAGEPRVVDGRSLLRWLGGLTFRWRSAAAWPDLVHGLATGDDRAAVTAYLGDRRALQTDYPLGERLAVECAEDRELPRRREAPGSLGAIVAASGDGAGAEAAACLNLPHGAYASPRARPARTPVLAVIGGQNIAGPPADVRRTLAPWPRAKLVVLPGRARAADSDWDTCVGPLVTAFLSAPERPLDTACTKRLRRPEFRAPAVEASR